MKKTWLWMGVVSVFGMLVLPVVAQAGAEARCKACHAFSDKNKMGPGLKGVYGRKAGTHPGYKYKFTKYIKGEPWVWDEEHLRAFLDDSKKAVREFTGNPKAKTTMSSPHIKGEKADEIIEFLKTLK